jgi:hypothetical protein
MSKQRSIGASISTVFSPSISPMAGSCHPTADLDSRPVGLSTNVAGIFSRYFVVGFVLPAFVALAVLDAFVPQSHQPPAYAGLDGANELVAIAGLALLLGLFLSAIHTGLLWVLDGWPIYEVRTKRKRGRLYDLLARRSDRDRSRLRATLSGTASDEEKSNAARRLRERFPADRPDLLPTRLGNARRSVETHPHRAYDLDGVQAMARIRFLLADAERQQIADAEGDVAFMVNGLTLVAPIAVLLSVVVVSSGYTLFDTAGFILAILEISWLAATVLYESALRVAADRWGPLVRAAFDLHLLELYDRMGVRRPATPLEDLKVGAAVNARLIEGRPVESGLRPPS